METHTKCCLMCNPFATSSDEQCQNCRVTPSETEGNRTDEVQPIATDSVFAASDLSELMKHYDQLAGYDPDNREVPQDTLFCGPVEEERRGWNWKDGNRRTKRGGRFLGFGSESLDNTLTEPMIPKYKKTGASSLVRLGFHKSLVGGINSRPVLPYPDKVIQILCDYASLPAQTYPHHVRLQLPPLQCASPLEAPFVEIPFKQRSGLYQRIKKCIRNHITLETIDIEN